MKKYTSISKWSGLIFFSAATIGLALTSNLSYADTVATTTIDCPSCLSTYNECVIPCNALTTATEAMKCGTICATDYKTCTAGINPMCVEQTYIYTPPAP